MKKSTVIVMTGLTVALLAGCNQVTKKETTGVKSSSQASSSIVESSVSRSSSSTQSEEFKVEVAKAIELFEKEYPKAAITSIDLDSSLGDYYYEVQGVDDTTEYEVRIQATTGEVKKAREERLDADEQNGVKKKEDALDTKDILSIKEASAIAEKDAGAGTAKEWSLDKEVGVTYWDVKVLDGHKEYEIKMNAKNGEILEREN
ncbi:PepSY domain-containing protein [Enterococcus rivorum]|uniref:PepSY domain-containing protein n=1 Tax=Enterococcus rivorum TaxID=762845 RepID=A0A1E5KXX9_9ENTE|nr:PepSY domain-containing protein [Enterococcus rivorum]MBP2099592.1 putative membrane protein YkoI [Enterococcus rivorum]OEH82732.1 hypothetical protein BCR26_11860 [Enterococcus rivorum]